jgi:hypothetical protein
LIAGARIVPANEAQVVQEAVAGHTVPEIPLPSLVAGSEAHPESELPTLPLRRIVDRLLYDGSFEGARTDLSKDGRRASLPVEPPVVSDVFPRLVDALLNNEPNEE